jgi:hypothetical protein
MQNVPKHPRLVIPKPKDRFARILTAFFRAMPGNTVVRRGRTQLLKVTILRPGTTDATIYDSVAKNDGVVLGTIPGTVTDHLAIAGKEYIFRKEALLGVVVANTLTGPVFQVTYVERRPNGRIPAP